MALEINTFPAKITEDMDDSLAFFIATANDHILLLAKSLNNSDKKKLDPKDGRKAIINISVNPKTGSIEFERIFIFPKESGAL